MKYIINESRLDEVVMSYIDSMFLGIQKYGTTVDGEIHPWWGIDGEAMIVTSGALYGEFSIGIEISIWEEVKSMFGLGTKETDEYFKKWIQKNLALKPVEIYNIY